MAGVSGRAGVTRVRAGTDAIMRIGPLFGAGAIDCDWHTRMARGAAPIGPPGDTGHIRAAGRTLHIRTRAKTTDDVLGATRFFRAAAGFAARVLTSIGATLLARVTLAAIHRRR